MAPRKRNGSLTAEEKRVVKALLQRGWRNQDIQALVNVGRSATINGARITEVKKSGTLPASEEATDFFILRKKYFDPQTGLNFFDDERLIRSREAMALAVQVFNSPSLKFKTEVFAMLANVAWTYLMHEFYARRGVQLENADGHTLLISQMVRRPDCPLSKGMVRNLEAMKEIRDSVEHKTLGRTDRNWLSLFQACCLNYDKMLCAWFGDRLSLQSDLSVALQFARLDVDQLAALHRYEVPDHIEALDARLLEGLTEADLSDLEYRFRVVYTLDSASKSKAHIHFIHPDSQEAEQVRNVLVKYRPADELYPYKPGRVVELVREKSGREFTTNNHVQAWRKFKTRPKSGAKHPDDTNKDYCIYHVAHRDYTYSDAWVKLLVNEIATDEGFDAIRAVKIS